MSSRSNCNWKLDLEGHLQFICRVSSFLLNEKDEQHSNDHIFNGILIRKSWLFLLSRFPQSSMQMRNSSGIPWSGYRLNSVLLNGIIKFKTEFQIWELKYFRLKMRRKNERRGIEKKRFNSSTLTEWSFVQRTIHIIIVTWCQHHYSSINKTDHWFAVTIKSRWQNAVFAHSNVVCQWNCIHVNHIINDWKEQKTTQLYCKQMPLRCFSMAFDFEHT